MTIHRKKLNPEYPKKPKNEKQQLCDLERRISMDVGSFLVLIHEGTKEQMTLAEQKAKSGLLKFGPDMKKLASGLGESVVQDVDSFIDSVDILLHCGINWIDEAKISEYRKTAQKLEKNLR